METVVDRIGSHSHTVGSRLSRLASASGMCGRISSGGRTVFDRTRHIINVISDYQEVGSLHIPLVAHNQAYITTYYDSSILDIMINRRAGMGGAIRTIPGPNARTYTHRCTVPDSFHTEVQPSRLYPNTSTEQPGRTELSESQELLGGDTQAGAPFVCSSSSSSSDSTTAATEILEPATK